jgi:hypothetical protein
MSEAASSIGFTLCEAFGQIGFDFSFCATENGTFGAGAVLLIAGTVALFAMALGVSKSHNSA